MPIDDRTTNRSYKLPNQGNWLADDVTRLREALAAIDADINARYTKAEVEGLINGVVNGAPGALNTLQELAAALGGDANFAATMVAQLALKANLTDVYTRAQADARYVQGQTQAEMVFIATANQAEFPLSTPVINKPSALVSIAGVIQPTSEYSLNQTGTMLTLSEGVPLGTVVRVLALGVASAGAPGDDTVTTQKMRDKSATNAKIAFDGGALSGFRNVIVNGAFNFWQQGFSFANPAGSSYTADQWQVVYNGPAQGRNITRQNVSGQGLPIQGGYFLRFNQSTVPTGASFNNLQQPIEFATTLAGGSATISFWAKANQAFTLPNLFVGQNFGTGGPASQPVFVSFGSNTVIGTTWQKYEFTVSVPSVLDKTFGADQNDYLIIGFSLPVNFTFVFDLALVQLEEGSSSTAFERRPSETEWSLCKRYWQNGFIGMDVYEESGGLSRIYHSFPVSMRTVPTISQTPNQSTNFSNTMTSSDVTEKGFLSGRYKDAATGKGTWINYYEASARF